MSNESILDDDIAQRCHQYAPGSNSYGPRSRRALAATSRAYQADSSAEIIIYCSETSEKANR